MLVAVCPNQGNCGTQVLNVHEGVRVGLLSSRQFEESSRSFSATRSGVPSLGEIGWNGSLRIYASYFVRSSTGAISAAFTRSYSPENTAAADSVGVYVFDVAADGMVLHGQRDSLFIAPNWSSLGQTPGKPLVLPESDAWGHQLRAGGEWVAYTALNREAGDYVVFLARTKPPYERWRVSPRGGEEPIWDRNGDLIYREGNRWMRVSPPAVPGARPGVATFVFAGPYLNVLGRSHDIAPNGKHLLVAGPSDSTTTSLTVVTQWVERLSRGTVLRR